MLTMWLWLARMLWRFEGFREEFERMLDERLAAK